MGDQNAPPFVIRRAGQCDAAALAAVSQATHLETFADIVDGESLVDYIQKAHSAEHYAGWLANDDMALWLAEHAQTLAPIGFAVASPVVMDEISPEPEPEPESKPDANDLELRRIYVLATHQGLGAGQALLNAVLDEARARGAKRMVLGTNPKTRGAGAFYARNGFVQIGQRQFMVNGAGYLNVILARKLEPDPGTSHHQ